MKRHAFTMQIKLVAATEYRQRDDELWPELAPALCAAGISDYPISLVEASLTQTKWSE